MIKSFFLKYIKYIWELQILIAGVIKRFFLKYIKYIWENAPILIAKVIKSSFLKYIWGISPILIAIPVLILVVYFGFGTELELSNYIPLDKGNLNKAQELTISVTTDLNKFVVSITTLMFGVLGFFINKYKRQIEILTVAVSYILSLIILVISYYFALQVYTQLTSDLAHPAYAMRPGESLVLFYLERSILSCFGAGIIILYIFVYVFLYGREPTVS